MKIAILAKNSYILPSPKTETWAPGVVIWNEARVLTKLKYDATVYCAGGSQVDGKVIDFDMPSFFDANKDVEPTQRSVRHPFYNNVYHNKVIKHLRENPVDIIHLHDFRDYPTYKNANLNTPIVVTIHGDFYLNMSLIPDVIKADMNEMNVIAISDVFEIPDGINPPFANIPNILELERFGFIEKPQNRLLFTSRLITEKGPDTAIEAAILSNKEIGIYGGIYGDGDWKNKLSELIENNENVNYFGYLPHGEITKAFDGKALLFPLREAEGFPSVVIESMISGTPVIAYAKSGVRSMIKDGVNGFLIEPGDINSMVEAIKKIDQIDRKKCREYTLEKYNELTIGNQLIETFEKAIENFKHNGTK
jgi:glycosyltransferase involved in cell wall biosynthesis